MPTVKCEDGQAKGMVALIMAPVTQFKSLYTVNSEEDKGLEIRLTKWLKENRWQAK